MAFVYRAERKLDFSKEETSKRANLGPGCYLGLLKGENKQLA